MMKVKVGFLETRGVGVFHGGDPKISVINYTYNKMHLHWEVDMNAIENAVTTPIQSFQWSTINAQYLQISLSSELALFTN